MQLTRNILQAAAACGSGVEGLSPGQVWAAVECNVAPVLLQEPMSPTILKILRHAEREAYAYITDCKTLYNADEMFDRLYSGAFPEFIAIHYRKRIADGVGSEPWRSRLRSCD